MPKLGRRAFLGLAGSVVLVAPGHANQEEGSSWQDSTGDTDVDVRLGRAGAYSFQELFSMSRTRLRALARAAVFIDSADPEKNVLVAGLGTEASWRFFDALLGANADVSLKPIIARVTSKSFDAARVAQIRRELRDLQQRDAELSQERERIEREDKIAWRIRAGQISKERNAIMRMRLFLAVWEEDF